MPNVRTAIHELPVNMQVSGLSVLVVPDNSTMNDLNRRARAERILTGGLSDRDTVRLTGHQGGCRNGDRWQIAHVHPDGSVIAQCIDPDAHTDARNTDRHQLSGQMVRLPAA